MNGVIYARYSCEKQTENSILGQVRECKLFAQRNNIEIVDIYKDEAISGRTAEKRPAFMKMISDAALNLFDCIIVWKGDRFSRSRADAAKYKSELKKFGIRVLSATEANVTGPEAVLMDGINEAFAEYFSVELAAKVERGMTQNTIDGKFNGGTLTLGYEKDGTSIKINEEEADVVREIFDSIANKGMTQNEILASLKKRGITAKNGKPLTKSTLNRMIHNTRYYGHYEFKGTSNDNIFPPIVTKELWDLANSKCRGNYTKRNEYKARVAYLLSNKVICGECLSTMTGTRCKGNGGEFNYYRCSGRSKKGCDFDYICKEFLEDAVLDHTIQFLRNNTEIDKLIIESATLVRDSSPQVSNYQNAIAKIDKKIDNLIDLAAESGDNKAISKKIKELEEQKNVIQRELNEVKRVNNIFSEDHVKAFLKNLKLRDYLSFRDKKYLIDTLVDKVYVFKDKRIKIFFNYSGSCTGSGGNGEVRLMNRSVHQNDEISW